LTRTALPLRLAWALTVHRSQGMSLGKLKVHLQGAFGAGMVYVALSRCTSLAGLQVGGLLMAVVEVWPGHLSLSS
jgi:ATP-dependent exoDNAse (exonuclease V) alpha subunit